MVDQETNMDSLVSLQGFCVIIMYFISVIYIFYNKKKSEVRIEQWIRLRSAKLEVSGSNLKLDR